MPSKKRIAILTGGGDAPGLNGIIEAVSLTLLRQGYEIVGIEDGFQGVFEERYTEITEERVKNIHSDAGTLLGTSNKSRTEGREEEFVTKFSKLGVEGLVAAGGDGTFAGLSRFRDKIPLIGVPKTIDNDLSGTEITFGYDTACSVVAEAVDALRATANAHKRVIVVETMGRTAGWIALGGGLASFCDVILLPEKPFSKPKLLEFLKAKQQSQRGLVAVVSEGAHAEGEDVLVAHRVKGSPQEERYGGIAERLARWIEEETGWDSRHVVLGHLQRARTPTATDRFLTLGMGVSAAQLVIAGQWHKAVVYRDGKIQAAPIADVMGPARRVNLDHRWLKFADTLGLFTGT
jgi:ATP-dependent phosphofructokinase / diphosphate-dependent phosphofructokinase